MNTAASPTPENLKLCVIEVRFSESDWNFIRTLAARWKVSYSWTIRFCIFKYLAGYPESGIRENCCLPMIADNVHRCGLCLYGADKKCIRAIACDIGMPASHLIRCAISWLKENLSHLDPDPYELYLHGIRIYHGLSFRGDGSRLDMQFSVFAPEDYYPGRFVRLMCLDWDTILHLLQSHLPAYSRSVACSHASG